MSQAVSQLSDTQNLPVLPHGWVWARLGKISEINPGFQDDLREELEVSFVPMRCVEEVTGKVDLSLSRALAQVRKGYTAFRNGDIIFAKITPCMENGKTAIVDNLRNGIGFGSTEFHVIRLIDKQIPRSLIFFFLVQEGFRKDAQMHMTGSAGQLRVPVGYIQEVSIPLPPLPEQHRIVAKIEELLTKLDAGVEALNKVKAQLKHYRQAVLRDAFQGKLTQEWREAHKGELEPTSKLLERIKEERRKNARGKHNELPPSDTSDLPQLPEGWVWTTVGAVADSMKNGIYKPPQSYAETGVACLRMYNIEGGVIVWKDIKRMSLTSDEVSEYELRPGDILVNRVNSRELVGKAATIPVGLETCVYESKNIRLRVLSDYVESKYVSLWFQIFSQQYFDRHAQQTVGMASINQQQLGSMPLPLAPTLEQHKIVEEIERHLSEADEIEKTIDHSLKQAERLRQSILKRAFEGKLVPQDPADEPAEKLLERIREERAKRRANVQSPNKGRKVVKQGKLLL